MGLDISAYSKIKKVEDPEEATIYIRRGIPENDQAKDIAEGEYVQDDICEISGFRAGSYSGYNYFRNLLAVAIHGVTATKIWELPDTFSNKEFYNIINFSDCEGHFGPSVSEKLHQDFKSNRHKFVKYIQDNNFNPYPDYYEEIYDNFTEGFGIAAKGGVLLFH